MKLWLHRLYLKHATPGVLEFEDGLELATLEDIFDGNRPGTCIPEGVYALARHDGPHVKNSWAIVGGTVSHEPAPGFARSACLFHGGDSVADTSGCVLVGLEHYYAVGKTTELSGCLLAMQALRSHLASEAANTLYVQRG